MCRFLILAVLLLFATSTLAQTKAERLMMAEGWGRGEWQNVHTIAQDPETGAWTSPPSGGFPWEKWTVAVHSPSVVELTNAFGFVSYVEFLGGTYRDVSGFDGYERINPIDHDVVEFEVHAADDWRLVYAYTGLEDQVAELRVLHDVFTWSNYRIDENGERRQTMLSIHRLVESEE